MLRHCSLLTTTRRVPEDIT